MWKMVAILAGLVVLSWLVFTAGAIRSDGVGGGDPIEAARGWIAKLLETPLPSGDLVTPEGDGCRREGIELFVAAGQSCSFIVTEGGSRVRRGLIRLRQGGGQATFTPAPSEATRPGPASRSLDGERALDLVAYAEGGTLRLTCTTPDTACRFRLNRPD